MTKTSSSAITWSSSERDSKLFPNQSLCPGERGFRPQQPPAPKSGSRRVVPSLPRAPFATRHHPTVPSDVQFHPVRVTVEGVVRHPRRPKVDFLSTGEDDSVFLLTFGASPEGHPHYCCCLRNLVLLVKPFSCF